MMSFSPLQAQAVQYTQPSWWFGVAGGANFNFYLGSTQQLKEDFTAPVAFDGGNGVSVYLAPLMEFYAPHTGLGFMLQTGYDIQSSAYKQQITHCNCPADLSTNLSYITFEPCIHLNIVVWIIDLFPDRFPWLSGKGVNPVTFYKSYIILSALHSMIFTSCEGIYW